MTLAEYVALPDIAFANTGVIERFVLRINDEGMSLRCQSIHKGKTTLMATFVETADGYVDKWVNDKTGHGKTTTHFGFLECYNPHGLVISKEPLKLQILDIYPNPICDGTQNIHKARLALVSVVFKLLD